MMSRPQARPSAGGGAHFDTRGTAMAEIRIVITGATDGAPRSPVSVTCRASSVAEAVAWAAQSGGPAWLPEKAFGRAAAVSVFVNGANLMLRDAARVQLADGDVLLLECPATDT